jgi:hypothetical protein
MRRAGVAAAVLVLTWAGGAAAQTQCADLSGTQVFGVGGSAQTPLIGAIASRLRGLSGDDQLTIIYSDAGGACTTTVALATAAPTAITGSAKYWDAGDATPKTCALPAGGRQADFGSMQNFWEFCDPDGNTQRPASIGDFEGPIGTVNIIVPKNSSQNSISASALHFVFGFGDDSGVEPWTDERFIIRRNENSAVQLYIAKAASLPPANFAGWDAATNGNSVNYVANATSGDTPAPHGEFDQAIGFVSGENAEKNRMTIRTLAYQHEGQDCAYWPDSSATAFDKINVRRGQYYLWGTAHFYAAVSGTESNLDDIENPAVKRLLGYITLQTPAPFESTSSAPDVPPVLELITDNYNVPQCAMQAKRSEDLGAIQSFQPDEPCGCYFEARATGRSSCDECETSNDCPESDPVCRYGFCEVQ